MAYIKPQDAINDNILSRSATQNSIFEALADKADLSYVNNLVPSQSGNSGKYLYTNGLITSWEVIPSALPVQNLTDVDKVLVTDGSNVSWQYAGLGAGSLGTGNVILGQAKPTTTFYDNNIMIGGESYSRSNGVAIGRYASSQDNGTSVGYSSNAQTSGSSLGNNAKANGSFTVSIGAQSFASGNSSIAIGGYSLVSGEGSIALGYSSGDNGTPNVLSIGSGVSNSFQINTAYIGKGAVPQTEANPVKIMTMRGTGLNTDLSIGTLTLAGSQSTGNQAGGDVIIATAPASLIGGTDLNSHVERIRAKATNEVVVNDTGVDFDFRVEGTSEQNLLFVNAGTNRIGIGTNNPTGLLDVVGSTYTINLLSNTDNSGSIGGGFQVGGGFYSNRFSQLSIASRASIGARKINTGTGLSAPAGVLGSFGKENATSREMSGTAPNNSNQVSWYDGNSGGVDQIGVGDYLQLQGLSTVRRIVSIVYNGLNPTATLDGPIGDGQNRGVLCHKPALITFSNSNLPVLTASYDESVTIDGSLVVNESGADKDVRIEGDTDENLLFVDASIDRVGIGLNNPSAKLEVLGDIKTNSSILKGSLSGTITLSAANSTNSYTIKMPSDQGAASTFLQNDGSGNLSWAPASGGSLPGGALEHQVLVYDGSAATWAYPGLGDGTLGTGNVILGRNKPTSLSGTNNILVGNTTGNSLTTGYANVVIGSEISGFAVGSGSNLTTGYFNTFLGVGTGSYLTTGSGNTYVGTFAGYENSGNSSNNTFIGSSAGQQLQSGSNNTIIGVINPAATLNNTTIIAAGTTQHIKIEPNNVAIGAGANNATGGGPYGEVAIGTGAVTTDHAAVAIGIFASAARGIAIGDSAVAGNNSVVFGRNSSSGGLTGVLALGASGYPVDTLYLGHGAAVQVTAQPVKIMTMRGTGLNTDLSIGTLTLAGSQSTGNQAGGDVIIATAPAGTSGSNLNPHVEIMRVTSFKEIKLTGGGVSFKSLHGQTGTVTATVADMYIGCNTAAAVAVNLPAAATAGAGKMYIIKDETGQALTNNITITPNGSEKIDTAGNYVIANNFQSITLVCDGSNWFII